MKILQTEITGTQTSFSTNFGSKLSFILSFHFPERLHSCYIYIFTAPTCTIPTITLEPCAVNAEFQHFILRFNKNFLTLQIPLKEGMKERVKWPVECLPGEEDMVTLQITLTS